MSANRLAANSSVWSGGGIGAVGDVRSDTGWLISKHGKCWLNEDHGGGFYMDDNDWIRSVNNKGIYTGGQLKGGSVRADGRASVGEYLQLDGIANEGWGCSPNGLVGRTNEGEVLFCKNGVWTKASKGKLYISKFGSQRLGEHFFCSLMAASFRAQMGESSKVGSCKINRDNNGVWFLSDNSNTNGEGCQAVCM